MIQKQDGEEKLIFSDERLYQKKYSQSLSKKSFLNFDGIEAVIKRDDVDSNFLKDEDSIFSSVLNPLEEHLAVISDLTALTNHNFLSYFSSKTPTSFINFFWMIVLKVLI